MPAAAPESRVATPPRAGRVAGVGALCVAALVVLGVTARSFVGEVTRPQPITPYVAPQYWLTYDYGFVRRALPGEVLSLLTGPEPPGLATVTAFGVALSMTAVAAVVVLAVLLARRSPDRWSGAAVAAAVLASPLGLSLYARDLGRTDAVGVVALVALAALPWRRLPTVVVVLAVAVLSVVAVATEEFLVAFVLPVGLLAVWRATADHRGSRWWCLAVAALPALALAVLSAFLPAPAAVLDEAVAASRAAGVPASPPLLAGQGDHDSVSRLRYGLLANIRLYYGLTTPEGVLASTVVWAAVHLLVVGLVWHLLGRSLRDRTLLATVTLAVLAALAVSVAGVDFRRWWSLATVAALSAVPLLPAAVRGGPPRWGVPLALALLVLAGAAIALQNAPVWPFGSAPVLPARVPR